jgi:putative nucleotide binding protein
MGEGKRDKIHHIVGRIPYDKLTQTARVSLEQYVEQTVSQKEAKFVEFFNKAQPINTRSHQIELIPGVGKKHMWEILEERKDKPFESFADIKERVKLMPDPKKAVIKRVMMEIRGEDKYRIFVSA